MVRSCWSWYLAIDFDGLDTITVTVTMNQRGVGWGLVWGGNCPPKDSPKQHIQPSKDFFSTRPHPGWWESWPPETARDFSKCNCVEEDGASFVVGSCPSSGVLPSRRLTRIPKIMVWKGNSLKEMAIFGIYVRFQDCYYWCSENLYFPAIQEKKTRHWRIKMSGTCGDVSKWCAVRWWKTPHASIEVANRYTPWN